MKNLARNRISDTKNSVDTFGSLQHALTNEYQSKMRKKNSTDEPENIQEFFV